jgi:cell division protein FtsQ
LNSKKTIRKIVRLGILILAAGGMSTLLIAANRKDQGHNCKDVAVTIRGVSENLYIDKSDILSRIKAVAKGSLINKPVTEVNLAALEQNLEKHLWIKDAELYFDSRDVLHVIVSEREPVARVFTTAGNSFYIDSSGQKLPLLDKVSVRVPVITNFTANTKLNAADSAQIADVKTIAQFINANEFWNAQIAQVDIMPSNTYELIPVVGNHTIRIGNAENLQEKFDRLMLFYKQVLSKVGIDKYGVVDVQYNGQVIGVNGNGTSAIDSIQLEKNIKDLMERSKLLAAEDSIAAIKAAEAFADTTNKQPVVETPKDEMPVVAKTTVEAKPKEAAKSKPAAVKPNPTPSVKPVVSKSGEKPKPKPVSKDQKQKPKAVMPKKKSV